ncbi:MAG: flagellar basal body-associated FliL family protein [Pelagimonas sp.]|jgi:hypothetical protein|nr:flagellar basal body-associated FliL family protein [Pelagimonas sp.]
MIKKILPIIFALVGTGVGVGAGLMLMPQAEEHAAADCVPPETPVEPETASASEEEGAEDDNNTHEYVKLNNQFIVPIMGPEKVQSLVVASLSVEVSAGTTENVYSREPKLRDVFLQVLFDHANIGGFSGEFTNGERMGILRGALLDAARSVLGEDVHDILITEIARQDT